jgi:hypothetical protein
MTTKPAIAINLNQLRDLMREFMSEVVTDDDNNIYAWPFETFLQWAKKRQQSAMVYCRLCRNTHPFNAGSCRAMDGIQ